MVLVFLILVNIVGGTQSTNVWFHKGSELMSSEKYNEAIKAYNKAIEIDLQDLIDWYNKGNALYNLNKSNEAITASDKSIEINPHDSHVWLNKGLNLYHLNKFDESIKAYDKAMKLTSRIRGPGIIKEML